MKKLLMGAIAVLALSLHAQAQGGLKIYVQNINTGAPITEAKVVVENPAIGYTQTKPVNSKGRATFRPLSTAGRYNVSLADTNRYLVDQATGLRLRDNEIISVTLTALPQGQQAIGEVQIRSKPYTRINTTDNEVSAEMDIEEIEQLPVEGRDMTRMLFRLPNVTRATGFFPEAPNVSVNGANSLYTNYQVDGFDNNENFLGGQKFRMPIGFVQNVSVKSNNFAPEHGITRNGVINVTTRSGSNQLSGEAYGVWRPGELTDAPSPFAERDLSGNTVKNGFQRYQGGFGVGGPIKKDQTFFYLNGQQTVDIKDNILNSPELGVNETLQGTNRFTLLSGKLDHYWNDSTHSSLRINSGQVSIERQGGGLEGGVLFPSAANEQIRNSLAIANKNQYQIGGIGLETNVQYSRFRWDYGRPEGPEDRTHTTIESPAGQAVAILGHPGWDFDETENTLQFQQRFSYQMGSHRLKAGLGLKSSSFSLQGGGNEAGNYTVRLDSNQMQALRNQNPGADLSQQDLQQLPGTIQVRNYSVELRPNAFEKTQNLYSAFIQDNWAATDRLNLNLGLRYDYDNLSKGGAATGDFNNLAPRAGFNYRIAPNQVLRGGYGLYYDKVLYAIYSDALQFSAQTEGFKAQLRALKEQGKLPESTDIDRVTNEGNFAPSQSDVDYLQGPKAEELRSQKEEVFFQDLRILNPNGYDNPYSHQFTIGYQYQWTENNWLSLDLLYNAGYNLPRLRNINNPSPHLIEDPDNFGGARNPAVADTTRPSPIFTDSTGAKFTLIDGDTARGGIARNILTTETEGRSNYYAATLTLRKDRGANDKWGYRFTYTLSFRENNTDDINYRAEDANKFSREWGPSLNDRRHVLNGIFYYYPLEGLSFSLASLIQSGQPIYRAPDGSQYYYLNEDSNRVFTQDLNGDGDNFGSQYVGVSDRQPGTERNDDRLPWSVTFDLGAQYRFDFPLAKGQFILRADVFNLFNAENLSGYYANATNSNQLQTGPDDGTNFVQRNAAPPRRFQFSARYIF